MPSQAGEREAFLKGQSNDPAYTAPAMEKEAEIVLNDTRPSWGVSPERRNEIFRKAGLSDFIKKAQLDEMDQDLIYMGLKTKHLKELIADFPSLPQKSLESAQKIIEEKKDHE
ncbi:MAG: hypothetical protein H7333_08535 [Bdellovibrionales bacterium]|nr:hypothetical protein [Oligoflexia bacterium]